MTQKTDFLTFDKPLLKLQSGYEIVGKEGEYELDSLGWLKVKGLYRVK